MIEMFERHMVIFLFFQLFFYRSFQLISILSRIKCVIFSQNIYNTEIFLILFTLFAFAYFISIHTAYIPQCNAFVSVWHLYTFFV